MTYALTSAGLWINRANQAWGTSRQYNVGSSFETDLGAMTTDRNNWQTNANTAYDSGVWGSGNHWHTNANTAYQSGTWGSGNTWHYNADQAWGPSRAYGSGNSFETNYNSLLNGLNNPDGLTVAAISLSWPDSGSSGTTILTLPRTGHFLIAIDARLSVNMSSGTNGYVQCNVGGVNAETYTINLTGSGGNNTPCFSKAWHGDYSSGQTVTLSFGGNWRNSGSASGNIYAHFVPNASYHN